MKMDERCKEVEISFMMCAFLTGYQYGKAPIERHSGEILAYMALGDRQYHRADEVKDRLLKASRLFRENFPDIMELEDAVECAGVYVSENLHEAKQTFSGEEEHVTQYSLPSQETLKAHLESLGLWGVL